ncbi:hypothetical protein [Streptomyces sp. NPDC013740]|uniref:hypothetical protein n=1 Tax=Streptomyces sp. NPDC013740 TaxID=3364867 RepID=UPI0036FA5F53
MRAALFAAVCVLLAATGHVLMSGQHLSGRALGLAFAGTTVAAWTLAGRERDLLSVTAAAVTVQGLLHVAFSWYEQDSAVSSPPVRVGRAEAGNAAAAHAGMGHGSMDHMSMAHGTMGRDTMGHGTMDLATTAHDMTDISSSVGMLSAHLLAALLSGLWMAYGERAVFRLLRALPLGLFRPLRLLLAAVVPVPARAPRLRRFRAGDERAPRRLLLAHSVVSRGPPGVVAVV